MSSAKLPSLGVFVEIRLSSRGQKKKTKKKKESSAKSALHYPPYFTSSRQLVPGHMSLGVVASYLACLVG